MDKENVICIYIIYIYNINITYIKKAIKNKEILTFTKTWIDMEGIMLSETSQTEKAKYCMISLICGI